MFRRFALLSTSALALAVSNQAIAQETQQAPTTATASAVVEEIVVTASSRAQAVVKAPASISVVTAETLANRPNADLTAALHDVEGVSISGATNERDIYIRGLPGSYTLILVDGKRQSSRDSRTNGNAGFEQSFTPPTAAIERIEVVRGPMSSLYGSDAIGGVINIITKKVPERWGGSAGADYVAQENDDSGNWNQAQAYVAGPLVDGVLGAQVWGRTYNRSEDHITNGANDAEDWNLSGRLAWTPSADHEILLQVDRTEVRRENSAGATLAATAASNYNTNKRTAGSLSWNGGWDWGTSALSILREETKRKTYTLRTNGFTQDVRAPEITNTVFDALFDIPLKDTFLGNHQLVIGGQWIENKLKDVNPGVSNTITSRFSVTQRAIFIEDEWQVFDQFALTGGIRLDDHERYGSHWSPRLYGVWTPHSAWTIKGGFSTGFRAPELRQVATGYAYTTGGAGCSVGPTGTCGVILGDPNIEPETSKNYEASIAYNPSREWSLSATIFRTNFEDKIENALVCGPDVNGNGICDAAEMARWPENPNYRLWYWYNLNDAQIQGIELFGRWRPIEGLSLKAGYTYTDSEQKSGDRKGWPLARTPEHMANARVDWDATDTLGLWGAVNYHGKEINAALRAGSNGSTITQNGVSIGRSYPAYTTADIGANWRITPEASIKFAVYNLTDKALDVVDYDFQGDGRRFWIGVSYDF